MSSILTWQKVSAEESTPFQKPSAVSEILAAVKVDEKGGKTVWASAHDLRRAFGARWSRKVNSMVLKELMRHASVTTTEKYYVGIQSDETSALLAGLMLNSPAEGE
jgi:integrase